MIAISGLLVVVAFVTLILGVFQRGLEMIYVSIAASVAAAVTLATGVVRSRPKAVAVGGPEPLGTWSGTATPVLDEPAEEQAYVEPPLAIVDEEPTTQVLRLDEDEDLVEEARPVARVRKTSTRSTAAKGAKKTAAKATGAAKAAKSTAGRSSVVVVPGRDKYHKDGCRYVKGQVTQTITRAAAGREGYKACGVCKP